MAPTEPTVVPEAPRLQPEPLIIAHAPGITSCRYVAHIGDSTSKGTMSSRIKDPELRLDLQYDRVGVNYAFIELAGGRSLHEHREGRETGPMVARRLLDEVNIDCWVIALGTNDAANVARDSTVPSMATRIEYMMRLVGEDPVLWVDTVTRLDRGYWSNEHMRAWNTELRRTLGRYSNAKIYRWSDDVELDWFVTDGIHYTTEGYTARASRVADALADAFPATAADLGLPSVRRILGP